MFRLVSAWPIRRKTLCRQALTGIMLYAGELAGQEQQPPEHLGGGGRDVSVVVVQPNAEIGVLQTRVERERLFDLILRRALAWSVAAADPREIDHINIHQASLRAMRRAVMALHPLPDVVLVDAFRVPDLPMPQRGVVHGDRRCAAIAAASIVAKVIRDRQMTELHGTDPRYGFDRHKGYATAAHLHAVARFGYSDAHRRSFRPLSVFDAHD